MADQKRTVKVVLDVSLGSEGAKGIAQLASSTKAAGDVLKSTRQQLGQFRLAKPLPPAPLGSFSPGRSAFFRPFGGSVGGSAGPAAMRIPLSQIKATADNTSAVVRSTDVQKTGIQTSQIASNALSGVSRTFADLMGEKPATAKGGAIAGYTPAPAPTITPADDREKTVAARAAAEQTRMLRTLGNLQLGGFAGRVGKAQALGQGLEGIGAKQLGGLVSKAALPIAIATAAADTAKHVALIGHDSFLNQAQVGRKLAQSNPVTEKLVEMHDAFTGRAGKIERAQFESAQTGAKLDTAARRRQFELSFNPQQANRDELAGQYGRAGAITMGPQERATAGGERAYQERSRLLPIQRAIADAERQAAGATAQRKATETELVKITQKELDLRRAQAKAMDAVNRDNTTGPERVVKLEAEKNATRALNDSIEARKQAQQDVLAAKQAEGQKKFEVGQHKAELIGAKADNLESRAATASSTAQRFGSMGKLDRLRGEQSYKAFLQYGPDKLSPEMVAEAQAFNPQGFAREAERRGKDTEVYKRGEAAGDTQTPGDPEKLREQAGAMRDEMERAKMDNQASLMKFAADAGKDFGASIRRVFDELLRNALREIERGKLSEKAS